jgi:hypothetical protein
MVNCELPHFEIHTHIDLFEDNFLTLFSDFFAVFGPQKNHFRIGRHENKEKKPFLL